MHSIGITSFSGKMGKVLVNELSKSKSCILKYAYTRNIPETKSEIPLTSDLEELVKTSDVIIDFSSVALSIIGCAKKISQATGVWNHRFE